MGLRCLLGHEYANREVEREREERGDEVVVTYRTVETCDRCGERRIVSENKEVRPVRGPGGDAVATGLGGHGGVTPDPEGEASEGDDGPAEPAAPADAPDPDAETLDTGDDPPVESVETESEADDPSPDPAEEDAIILDGDDDDESEDRRHGEWPEADEESDASAETEAETDDGPDVVDDGATVVSAGDDWPEPEGEDEGFDAEPTDGDPPEASFGGGLTPEGDADREAAAATNGTTGSVAGKQFVAAEEVEPVGDDGHEGETEFFCPNCGYARVAGGSSMRAGDICPDCHEGYIGERER